MIKAIPNRTTGLQKKEITDGVHEASCIFCKGKGFNTVQLPATAIRNIKVHSSISVDNNCEACGGEGKIRNKIRIIRKNKVTAIL